MVATATALGIAGLAASAGGAIASADAQRKALHAQQDAAKASQVNVPAIEEKTRALARQNALDSAALEKQLTPLVPQLRDQSNRGVIDSLNDRSLDRSSEMLHGRLGQSLDTPLLRAAIAKAQSDLALGGNLSTDVQNMATRSALAKAGTVAPGSLGLGRDLVARDLGLTAQGIEQQRLQAASQIGGQELDLATSDSTNFLNTINMLRAINDAKFGKNLAAAQYGESIQRPVVGLDPSAYANLTTGNANAASAALTNTANIQGQQAQNYGNLAGQALGYGLMAYNQRAPSIGYQAPAGGYQPSGYGIPSGAGSTTNPSGGYRYT